MPASAQVAQDTGTTLSRRVIEVHQREEVKRNGLGGEVRIRAVQTVYYVTHSAVHMVLRNTVPVLGLGHDD